MKKMRSLYKYDFPRYTDIYAKYCPHCGEKFFTDRKRDIFHSEICYRQYYSLTQYCERAKLMVRRNLPTKREWALRSKDKLENYLFDLVGTTTKLHIIQEIPDVQVFMKIHQLERSKEIRRSFMFKKLLNHNRVKIITDLKEIVDYPPAFEEDNVHNDFQIGYLLQC